MGILHGYSPSLSDMYCIVKPQGAEDDAGRHRIAHRTQQQQTPSPNYRSTRSYGSVQQPSGTTATSEGDGEDCVDSAAITLNVSQTRVHVKDKAAYGRAGIGGAAAAVISSRARQHGEIEAYSGESSPTAHLASASARVTLAAAALPAPMGGRYNSSARRLQGTSSTQVHDGIWQSDSPPPPVPMDSDTEDGLYVSPASPPPQPIMSRVRPTGRYVPLPLEGCSSTDEDGSSGQAASTEEDQEEEVEEMEEVEEVNEVEETSEGDVDHDKDEVGEEPQEQEAMEWTEEVKEEAVSSTGELTASPTASPEARRSGEHHQTPQGIPRGFPQDHDSHEPRGSGQEAAVLPDSDQRPWALPAEGSVSSSSNSARGGLRSSSDNVSASLDTTASSDVAQIVTHHHMSPPPLTSTSRYGPEEGMGDVDRGQQPSSFAHDAQHRIAIALTSAARPLGPASHSKLPSYSPDAVAASQMQGVRVPVAAAAVPSITLRRPPTAAQQADDQRIGPAEDASPLPIGQRIRPEEDGIHDLQPMLRRPPSTSPPTPLLGSTMSQRNGTKPIDNISPQRQPVLRRPPITSLPTPPIGSTMSPRNGTKPIDNISPQRQPVLRRPPTTSPPAMMRSNVSPVDSVKPTADISPPLKTMLRRPPTTSPPALMRSNVSPGVIRPPASPPQMPSMTRTQMPQVTPLSAVAIGARLSSPATSASDNGLSWPKTESTPAGAGVSSSVAGFKRPPTMQAGGSPSPLTPEDVAASDGIEGLRMAAIALRRPPLNIKS